MLDNMPQACYRGDDDMLSIVAELQAGRRTGQTDHMFGIPDGSVSNGYQKRRRPGGAGQGEAGHFCCAAADEES
ncbi:hypothetical protein [Rhizobium sp. PEPV16]|uniref:hypothetical protein n=1 Tax=Rhizobium sp. PEPV16 TaxID=1820614 RepID=UPI001FEE51B7|nr:hypothetical protein [Rhizobium sp. PEPV16]